MINKLSRRNIIVFTTTALLVFTMLLLQRCRQAPERPWPGAEQIDISWGVLSNVHHEQARVKARFVVRNRSDFALNHSNWVLYFNKSPRLIFDGGDSIGARVEHISGDWHRMVPLEGFSLQPGESFALDYEARFWWIKETDAPKGLYFVFTDEQGDETPVPVANFSIDPFAEPGQLTRHQRDRQPIPTPEWLYENNRRLRVLPARQLIPVIPSPQYYALRSDSLEVNSSWRICFRDDLDFEARWLANQIKALWGINLMVLNCNNPQPRTIFLSVNDTVPSSTGPEAYKLEVEVDRIRIAGNDAAGVFYGLQSLVALAGVPDKQFRIPRGVIDDAPRFAWRGMHIDVARNFHGPATLKKVIDLLAFYKINTLHLHLTDDEGWRIEVKALPELTQVGGRRGHTHRDSAALHPSFGSGPFVGQLPGSGFFSQEEFMDLLIYAHRRHIRVIPEINFPGHARAAIKAMEARYLHFTNLGDDVRANQYRLIDPDDTSVYLSAQLFNDNVVNVARESLYDFITAVVDELIEMYAGAGVPLEMIHMGGDEVPAGVWTQSPMIEEKMIDLPHITRPANMHAYFTQRVLELLKQRELTMGGWEEVAMKEDDTGAHQPNTAFAGGAVVPFVWNNLWGAQDLAYRIANSGFPVVLCHVTAFYFDLAYNKDPREPGLYWGGFVDARSAWQYSPYDVFRTTMRDNMGTPINTQREYRNMERLLPGAQKNILGVQAQLWSETVRNRDMLEYYLLPKLAGFAETAWAAPRSWETAAQSVASQQMQQQWNVFANTLARRELPRLAHLSGGFNYRIPPPGAIFQNGQLLANTEYPGLQIRFTDDGTEPDKNATVYTKPVAVESSVIKLRAFDAAGRASSTTVVYIELPEDALLPEAH